MTTSEEQTKIASAFQGMGFPLYCPHCSRTVNLFLVDYRRHLLSSNTCLYCRKEWKLVNNKWS